MGDFVAQNPLLLVIAGAEIAFWVFLVAGLAARYLLRVTKVSTVLLLCVPLVDVVLVTAALTDVATGGTPGLTHGLAGLYLGFTVAFGHSMVRWADVRFAHRFAGGPPPVKPPKGGPARIRREWSEFAKMLLALAITVVVITLVALVAGTPIPSPTAWPGDPMWTWASRAVLVAAIWLVAGPLWYTLFARSDAERGADRDRVDAR